MDWTETLPETEGLYAWYQPDMLPKPCCGIAKVSSCDPCFGGWPAKGNLFLNTDIDEPTLLCNRWTLWKKLPDDFLSLGN